MGNKRYKNGFEITIHEDIVNLPLKWKEPKYIFVNSMSDLFHEKVPFSFIQNIFKTMEKAHWHTFQVLTKRSRRLAELSNNLNWSPNIWVGVTVESQRYINRIYDLKIVPANIKFVSFEPLLSSISDISLEGLNWIIVGGESGPKCRTIKAEWIRLIRDLCTRKEIPFFFKQWGGTRKKSSGNILDGKIWTEVPQNTTLLAHELTCVAK
jgi:protein gp37